MTKCPAFDFADPNVQRDPFAAYESLRANGSVHRDPTTGFYVVLDYALICEITLDVETFSNETGVIAARSGELGELIQQMYQDHGVPMAKTLLITDPPRHKFFRSFVDRAFSVSRVRKLESYLTEVIDDLIATFADAGSVEFMSRMAELVPVYVVADLVGADRSMVGELKRWSDAGSAATDPSMSREKILENVRLECDLQRYILDQANRYRSAPADTLLSDVANAELDGRRLTDSELVSMMLQVFIAGHETTTGIMGNAMKWLVQTPGLEDHLRTGPAAVSAFIEEILRLESPLQGMFRRATRNVVLDGIDIPSGSVIMIRYGAANRDANKFECPEKIDLERPGLRQHLAFGSGIHFCVGNQLARAELRITFSRLLHHFRHFKLMRGKASIVYGEHYFIHGLKHLDITFDKNTA